MIYDYILSPHPRRLVFTSAWLPSVTLPVNPVLFGKILDLVEQEGEAGGKFRLQSALHHALTTPPSAHDTEATAPGEAHD